MTADYLKPADIVDAMIARQGLTPYNVDDAEYIVAHPDDFPTTLVRLANVTVDEHYAG